MQHFNYLATVFVLGGIASAIIIASDLRTRRQPMRIMESVWILTGLWASFFGLWAYFAFGRAARGMSEPKDMSVTGMSGADSWKVSKPEEIMHSPEAEMSGMQTGQGNTMGTAGMADKAGMPGMAGPREAGSMGGMEDMPGMKNMAGMKMPERPRWQSVVLSTLHCGAGCTLADIVGEWFLFFVPVAIGGSLLAGTWTVDYILALVFGIGFQYAAIRGMERTLSRGEAVRRAAKADILSLTAWQAGMYGWMAVAIFALNGGEALPRTSFAFWFMMQIAMACGFLVALPVNILLIRTGIKKGM